MTRVLLLLLALPACRGEGPRLPTPLTRALLAVSGEAGTRGLAELDRIAGRVRQGLGAGPAAAFNRVVFEELGFEREVADEAARFMLLAPVLEARRGSCVGLGSLYLALGERLGIRVEAVLVPGHFFVRLPDATGRMRNVELLRRGEEMDEAWYRRRYGVPAQGASAYLRPLSADETVAVVRYNLGNDLRRRGRLPEARAEYARAAGSFPAFAEAHASLGLTRHLLGDLDGAGQAYAAARRARPDLPGLDRNLALLQREREVNR